MGATQGHFVPLGNSGRGQAVGNLVSDGVDLLVRKPLVTENEGCFSRYFFGTVLQYGSQIQHDDLLQIVIGDSNNPHDTGYLYGQRAGIWYIMYSDRAVMVRLGLTPRLAGTTEPSATNRLG